MSKLNEKLLKPFYVAGVQFHELNKVIDELKDGDELDMTEEHDNKYDPYAVAIYYNHTQLGYVPKTLSALVTNAMYDFPLSLRIVHLDRDAKPWQKLLVRIEEAEL